MHKLTKLLLFPILLCLLSSGSFAQKATRKKRMSSLPATGQRAAQSSDDTIARAFANRTSNLQVKGEGRVIRLLSDDVSGSRHQRFIVQLASGQTLLISHNIDIAPRINNLKTGDRVGFYGEYEWNAKGGVIHWTHHDPRGRHVTGWIFHKGRTYQ